MNTDPRKDNQDRKNPGQTDYEKKSGFNPHANKERMDQKAKNIFGPDELKNQEDNPDGSWANKVAKKDSGSIVAKGGVLNGILFKNFKKRSPLATIIILVVGGGIGIGALLSPSLLIVQIKEIMVDKFNTQLTSMDVRTRKVLYNKLSSATTGVCGSTISIGCKFSTMSEKQVAKFKDAGIDVVSEKTTITGRYKVSELKYDGKSITAKNFLSEFSDDTNFRSAVKKAYNPKYVGFADSIWKKVASKLGISKKATEIDGDTDTDKLKSLQEDVNGKKTDVDSTVTEGVDSDGNKVELDESASGTASDITKELDGLAEDVADTGTKTATEVVDAIADGTSSTAKFATNSLKITGIADNLCLVYNTVRAVGFAAKVVRAEQLIKFAMVFLNTADQIKAGTASTEDVSYLGKLLTEEDANGQTATDSFGYLFSAYGDTSSMTESSMQYMVGAGLAGSLVSITSLFNKYLGTVPSKTCKTLNNTFVSIGSAIAGIAAGIASGGSITAANIAFGVVINLAAAFLPALLADIIAGVVVDESTVGGEAGDAITSGSGALMGNLAKSGGNSPLTPDEAVAYNNLTYDIAKEYAEEDRLAYGQFDITNTNTFLGKLFSKLTPYLSKLSSITGIISSLTSITTDSIAALSPSSAYADDSTSEYTQCTDYDYMDPNGDGDYSDRIATDPFCNVVYGIPTDALDTSTEEVLAHMSGQIDNETGKALSGSAYETFLKNCTNRENPIGYTDSDNQGTDGSECLFSANSNNKYFYLYTIDNRVLTSMDED